MYFIFLFFFFKQKTAYEMRISDWSSDVCSSDLPEKQEDARFLVDAASYNILATQLAQEATNSAYSASVVQMARDILEEHEAMAKELKKLARGEKIKIGRASCRERVCQYV